MFNRNQSAGDIDLPALFSESSMTERNQGPNIYLQGFFLSAGTQIELAGVTVTYLRPYVTGSNDAILSEVG
jgi:hypothetical protein